MEIHGKHNGETIVILGTGPSIYDVDFSLLEGVTTIGVNKILFGFDPDYLVWLDRNGIHGLEDISAESKAEKYCSSRAWNKSGGKDVIPFERYNPRDGQPFLTSDFKRGLYHGPSSIFAAINLAYIFGAERVILLGVDLHNGAHFYDEKGKDERFPSFVKILDDFIRLSVFCRQTGFEIINASINSLVGSLEKMRLEECLTRYGLATA